MPLGVSSLRDYMRYNKRLAEYVNSNFSFADEWVRIFGKELPTGNVFCPFHENTNTPAAKVYGNGLKCFSCQRYYSVYDLLRKFDPEKLVRLNRSILLPAGLGSGSAVRRIPFVPWTGLDLSQKKIDLFKFLSEYSG